MDCRRAMPIGIFFVAMIFLLAETAGAVYLDGKRASLEFYAKAQTRVSIRLQDSDGFTSPPDISVGDLVQWRNLALLEVTHDLKYLTRELDILYPLKALKIHAKYHLVGRFMYEAVYNVGPQAFRDVRAADKENIDNFKQAYDLWECYIDLSRQDLFLRIGRQNLSWGETDLFRLLDNINPLDNTFGGPFEDLDDRRIPLWMLRGSYNFGKVGPVGSLTLEGFWVPGNWDVRVAPLPPSGTPFSPPAPESPLPLRVLTPSKVMSNSRWGVRLMGVLANNYNFSVGHYQSFLDIPALRLGVGESPLDAWSEISYPDVQVTGGSLSFWESHTDVIVRTEVAWFWDEAVFIPEENTPLDPAPPLLQLLGIPGLPANGAIPKKNHLKWMIGLDKQMWIRWLNNTNTFLFSFQWFASWVQDYDERMRQPLSLYPDATKFATANELESTITGAVTTMYRNGTLTPTLALGYDPRGAWLIQPSLALIHEPFRFALQYSAIAGNMVGFGAYRDRDQLTFILTYLLD